MLKKWTFMMQCNLWPIFVPCVIMLNAERFQGRFKSGTKIILRSPLSKYVISFRLQIIVLDIWRFKNGWWPCTCTRLHLNNFSWSRFYFWIQSWRSKKLRVVGRRGNSTFFFGGCVPHTFTWKMWGLGNENCGLRAAILVKIRLKMHITAHYW